MAADCIAEGQLVSDPEPHSCESQPVNRCLIILALFIFIGCKNDEMYIDLVGRHLARGPEAACCITYGGIDTTNARCRAEAPTRCAFAKDARLTYRIEHQDSNSATVYVDLAGPSGTGSCTFAVSKSGGGKRRGIRIQNG
jgi:hypothetical protein